MGRFDGVVDGGGKLVLGREAIIDGDHDQFAFDCELAGCDIMGVKIADHPAAAVEEYQGRRQTVTSAQPRWHVEAGRDRAMRRRDRQRFDTLQAEQLRFIISFLVRMAVM